MQTDEYFHWCFGKDVVGGQCFSVLSLWSGGHLQELAQLLVLPSWQAPQAGFVRAHEEVGVIFVHSASPTCALAEVAVEEMVCRLVIINSFRYVHVHAKPCTGTQLCFSTIEILSPS